MSKSGKKKRSGMAKPVHKEHLDEIINQKSMPSFLASVSFHMILLIVILLIPAIPARRDQASPHSYIWDGEKPPEASLMDDTKAKDFDPGFIPEKPTGNRHKINETSITHTVIYHHNPGRNISPYVNDWGDNPDLPGIPEGDKHRPGGDLPPGLLKEIGILPIKGIDIMIVFDSTDSMTDCIADTKKHIGLLTKLIDRFVRRNQIGMVTYRDYTDQFVVKGIPLCKSPRRLQKWLNNIEAAGGGDHSEALVEGLKFAVQSPPNGWRRASRKVIIIFGDAPPHHDQMDEVLELAKQFTAMEGKVHVIDTAREPVGELKKIARAGKGNYVRLKNAKELSKEIFKQIFDKDNKYQAKLDVVWQKLLEDYEAKEFDNHKQQPRKPETAPAPRLLTRADW